MEQSRMRPRRTASETRVPLMRQPSSRRLYGEVPVAPSRRDGDGLTDVYDMYGPQRGMRNRVPEYIDEDDEYGSDEDSAADMQFEMMPPTYASRSMSTRRSSRGKTVQSFRVKVHALDDIRYIMITRDTSFGELEGKIREKFNFRNRLRIRMRDDGDMITMGDQEDLDLLLRIAADEARRENLDMGKLEVCPLFSLLFSPPWLTRADLGGRAMNGFRRRFDISHSLLDSAALGLDSSHSKYILFRLIVADHTSCSNGSMSDIRIHLCVG